MPRVSDAALTAGQGVRCVNPIWLRAAGAMALDRERVVLEGDHSRASHFIIDGLRANRSCVHG